ncbi:hypothetical protein C4J81_15640 [Deltaproteobacteria bacterium Smac51]|nr:hypothetical protein C4J81_15640 [Deltaproteobacteria bacterium Smac51]
MRRYRRRCKVERFFAWLNKYKRIFTRWDRDFQTFAAFVHLACATILLKGILVFMK